MTIKQFAKKYSISTQAVYQKLKAANIPLTDIKQGDTQELTDEGIKQLEKIFAKKNKENTETIERLKIENQLLNDQIKEIRADRERWVIAAKTAQEALAAAQEALQREQQATHQAQAIQMATIQAIGPKRSLWARITGKTKDDKQ